MTINRYTAAEQYEIAYNSSEQYMVIYYRINSTTITI